MRKLFNGGSAGVLAGAAMAALAAAWLAAPCFGETPGGQDYDARLASVTGQVDVLAAGESDLWREAEEGMPLAKGDTVRTGGESSADITLDDGGVVRLGAGSTVELSSLVPKSSSFSLKIGSLVAKIRAGFIKAGGRLAVRTPAAVCAVRGTEFGVEHDEASGETTAGVFDEGSLSVSSLDEAGGSAAEELVGKGREVRLRRGAKAFKAGAMRRLARHRKGLETARARLEGLPRTWKRLGPEKRAELRERFRARKAFKGRGPLKRLEEIKKAVPERKKQRRDGGDRRRPPGPRGGPGGN